jgi:hypothetical protein
MFSLPNLDRVGYFKATGLWVVMLERVYQHPETPSTKQLGIGMKADTNILLHWLQNENERFSD